MKVLPSIFLGDLRRIGFGRGGARLQIALHAFEASAIFVGGAQRLAARQQKIAGKAVFDAHDVAHLAEPRDTFEEDDFHSGLL